MLVTDSELLPISFALHTPGAAEVGSSCGSSVGKRWWLWVGRAQSWCSPPEESPADCNVSDHGQSSHEKSCKCLCHQTLCQLSNPTIIHVDSTSLLLLSSNPCPALPALGSGCPFIFEQRNTRGKTRLGEDSS